MTGCLTFSIRPNEKGEKADHLTLQIAGSGVKLQEYVNYLNWSGDGFPDNQFDAAADRVTRVAHNKKQIRHIRNGFKRLDAVSFVEVILFGHVRCGCSLGL